MLLLHQIRSTVEMNNVRNGLLRQAVLLCIGSEKFFQKTFKNFATNADKIVLIGWKGVYAHLWLCWWAAWTSKYRYRRWNNDDRVQYSVWVCALVCLFRSLFLEVAIEIQQALRIIHRTFNLKIMRFQMQYKYCLSVFMWHNLSNRRKGWKYVYQKKSD